MVICHSEIFVGSFITNGFRVQSLKMRQTLDKWTWCNTPARVPIAPNRNSTTCCHQIGWTRCWSQIPYQSLKIVSQDLGFQIGIACLVAMMIGQSSGFEALRSSILTDFHLPLTSLDFYLSTTCPRKYNLKYKHTYKFGWKYGFLLLLRSLDSNLPSMCSRLLLRPPSQVRGSIYADTGCILYTQ